MDVDEKTVRRIARLARIRITDEEVPKLRSELVGILDWVKQLDEVDTDGVEPMTHPQAEALRERADEITEPDRRAENQAMAPAVEDGLYLVPKVID